MGEAARWGHEVLGTIIIAHTEHYVMPKLVGGVADDILALSHMCALIISIRDAGKSTRVADNYIPPVGVEVFLRCDYRDGISCRR